MPQGFYFGNLLIQNSRKLKKESWYIRLPEDS